MFSQVLTSIYCTLKFIFNYFDRKGKETSPNRWMFSIWCACAEWWGEIRAGGIFHIVTPGLFFYISNVFGVTMTKFNGFGSLCAHTRPWGYLLLLNAFKRESEGASFLGIGLTCAHSNSPQSKLAPTSMPKSWPKRNFLWMKHDYFKFIDCLPHFLDFFNPVYWFIPFWIIFEDT